VALCTQTCGEQSRLSGWTLSQDWWQSCDTLCTYCPGEHDWFVIRAVM